MRPPAPTGRHPRKTSRDDGRRWNLLATLQTVAARGTTTRAEIARATGLTRTTVSSLVAELIAEDLVQELGPAEAESAGKPPTLLTVNQSGRVIVAVDLSHQPFEGAVMDLSGAILFRTRATEAAVGSQAIGVAAELIATCLEIADAPVLGIGVGTPGMIDPDGGIREAAHLEWHDVPLRSILSDRFELPVAVGNDAHVSALAQWRNDLEETLLLVTVGEGIGAGLILNGVLHAGEHLSSGEIGHVVVDSDGAVCRCGLQGCLETVAAVPAVAAADGSLPIEASVTAGRRLGATLAVVIAAVDVDHIVVASEFTAVPGYVEAVERELRNRLHLSRRDTVTVRPATTPDLVLSGAAVAAMRDVLGVVLR
jgi:predicted NBD/HSP70 family sugar kinase